MSIGSKSHEYTLVPFLIVHLVLNKLNDMYFALYSSIVSNKFKSCMEK